MLLYVLLLHRLQSICIDFTLGINWDHHMTYLTGLPLQLTSPGENHSRFMVSSAVAKLRIGRRDHMRLVRVSLNRRNSETTRNARSVKITLEDRDLNQDNTMASPPPPPVLSHSISASIPPRPLRRWCAPKRCTFSRCPRTYDLDWV